MVHIVPHSGRANKVKSGYFPLRWELLTNYPVRPAEHGLWNRYSDSCGGFQDLIENTEPLSVRGASQRIGCGSVEWDGIMRIADISDHADNTFIRHGFLQQLQPLHQCFYSSRRRAATYGAKAVMTGTTTQIRPRKTLERQKHCGLSSCRRKHKRARDRAWRSKDAEWRQARQVKVRDWARERQYWQRWRAKHPG